jgi:DNA-binding FrmR family transcriptional regulator
LPARERRKTDRACETEATASARRALVLRLKRIEGQLRGIQSMIEADADCEAIAQQMSAARKALDKTYFELAACAIAHPRFAASSAPDPGGERPGERLLRITRTLAKYA